MNDSPKKKQTGRVNYLWIVGGGYLLYTAMEMLIELYEGNTAYPVLSVIGAAVFIIVGGLMVYRECKAYRYGLKHINDPSSWSDEPEALEDVPKTAEEEP